MTRAVENILFTSFIGLVVVVALFISLDWPVRASIVILLLGSIGIVLTAIQLVWGFLYGVFEQLLHVPWPKPWLGFLLPS
jgi:hypothetical protein